jgi:hypothetical protein
MGTEPQRHGGAEKIGSCERDLFNELSHPKTAWGKHNASLAKRRNISVAGKLPLG